MSLFTLSYGEAGELVPRSGHSMKKNHKCNVPYTFPHGIEGVFVSLATLLRS